MSLPTPPPPATTPPAAGPHESEAPSNPRADFHDALGWLALGLAILCGSLTMDRLEAQGVTPYTVPGLLPGLLGIAMMLLGALLAVRSWRAGAFAPRAAAAAPAEPGARGRLLLVLALCLGFGVVLVGHGLPFWLAAALFVTVAILTLQHAPRRAAGRKLTLREMLVAAAIGLGAGLAITLVFQEIFLVRLP
jgi:hypothetical protein